MWRFVIYHVSCGNPCRGAGTKDNPFQTIGQAAKAARAGDQIIIGKGVYREWVDPRYGGLSPEQRVVYMAAPGETPVISGAEVLAGWRREPGGLWKNQVDNALFGSYNPFADPIFGDWFDGLGQEHHTGQVYVDGKAMYEAASLQALQMPAQGERALRWHAAVSDEKTELWCDFQDLDPNERLVEISVRPCCFFPSSEGVNYITVSGLWVRQAATQWAPPTAFQQGALGTHWSKGWIIENCIVSDARCSGISLGKRRDAADNAWSLRPRKGGAQTYTELIFLHLKRGWSKENVGGHQIRGNEIYNCGQAGIVGSMGGAFSLIRDNHIHDINTRGEFSGAEIAGIKLHAAIDTVLSDNCIHHCRRGLWLDWQAQGARVSGNAFFDNTDQDLFIEVCHGPCVIDNNLFLSPVSLLNVSQGSAFVHNLFLGKLAMHNEINRFTLYHLPHDTFVGGVMLIYGGDDRVAGNIYIGRGGEEPAYGNAGYDGYRDIQAGPPGRADDSPTAYGEDTLPVDIHGNLYLGGARPYKRERNASVTPDAAEFHIQQRGGDYYLATNLFDLPWRKPIDLVTSDVLGSAFEPEARYENADGTALSIDTDFSGNHRAPEGTCAGPFEAPFSALRLNRKARHP